MRAAVSLGFMLAALGTALPAAAAARLFCCNDDSGRQVCGDILPQACYGRAYREIGESGYTVRRVEAPLSAEQRAQREIDEKRRQEEAVALKEQQRKDTALLNTYGSEADVEAMRARAEQDVRKSIADAEAKIVEARKNRQRFEDEAEFYKKKSLPADIDKGLREADFEIKAQQSVIAAKHKELEVVRAKYDEDRRRFIDLTRRRAAR